VPINVNEDLNKVTLCPIWNCS